MSMAPMVGPPPMASSMLPCSQPSPVAIEKARSIIFALDAEEEMLVPSRIAPVADGGVAITFGEGSRYARVECTEDGDVVAATSDGHGNVDVWDVSEDGDGVTLARSDIRAHLCVPRRKMSPKFRPGSCRGTGLPIQTSRPRKVSRTSTARARCSFVVAA
jgi:hypothetical protein